MHPDHDIQKIMADDLLLLWLSMICLIVSDSFASLQCSLHYYTTSWPSIAQRIDNLYFCCLVIRPKCWQGFFNSSCRINVCFEIKVSFVWKSWSVISERISKRSLKIISEIYISWKKIYSNFQLALEIVCCCKQDFLCVRKEIFVPSHR